MVQVRALRVPGSEGVAACTGIGFGSCDAARSVGVGRGTKFVPPYRPGVSLALDAGPASPLFAPSLLGKEMFPAPWVRAAAQTATGHPAHSFKSQVAGG